MNFFSIAIDGPAGVGKSTVCDALASRLGALHLDTGAMYRALAVYFLDRGILPEDREGMERSLKDARVEVLLQNGKQHMRVNDEDVTDRLRTEEVSRMASVSSQYPAVRAKLLNLQRDAARSQNIIMDGRDIGTVILPDALLKVFLTASPAVRALRRFEQLKAQGLLGDATPESLEAEIKERDLRDSTRAEAPLKKAEDAVELDTSLLTIEQVIAEVERRLYERMHI